MAVSLQQLSTEMADVVAGVRRSLVHVHNGHHGTGAGSIWHSDGLILTNAHVVGSRAVQVTLPDGRRLPARLLAHDGGLDLAALSVNASDLSTIPIGESRRLQPGQMVMAMGHPWGVSGAVAAGVVIGVGPHLPEAPMSGRDWIAADLLLRPGHSGGPMMDAQGRLVGINTMIVGPDVAIAVPVHVVKAFLRDALPSARPGALAASRPSATGGPS